MKFLFNISRQFSAAFSTLATLASNASKYDFVADQKPKGFRSAGKIHTMRGLQPLGTIERDKHEVSI